MDGEDERPDAAEPEVDAPGTGGGAAAEESSAPLAEPEQNGDSGEVIGSAALRPVFLGNLRMGYTATDITEMFTRPMVPRGCSEDTYDPIPVDRVDVKRGYCFVFLKDATSQNAKDQVERFVSDINGMDIPNVSNALRAEFAKGDGRVKRKEDIRRRHIQPSETLFVVNFHEETTKREHLQMLFEPFGQLVRIDMKRNYAFVQFRTIEEATRAKEVTDGGKLDQSVLTVEYVARQRGEDTRVDRRRRDDHHNRRYNDRRGGGRDYRGGGGGGDRYEPRDRYDRDRYDDNRGGRSDFRGRGRDRSPMYRSGSPMGYRNSNSSPQGGGGGGGGGYRNGSPYRRRSRSRSRSPRGYRSRSPGGAGGGGTGGLGGRYDDRDRMRYDDHRDGDGGGSGGGGGRRSPVDYRDRQRSPDRDTYRGGRDDRGYRP